MRRSILTFRRDGTYFAELHLDLAPAFYTVESWAWYGDPSAKDLIAPLPNVTFAPYGHWRIDARDACERLGLSMSVEYKGDPIPGEQDYFPSQESLDARAAIDEAWDRAVASGWDPEDHDMSEVAEYLARLMKTPVDKSKTA